MIDQVIDAIRASLTLTGRTPPDDPFEALSEWESLQSVEDLYLLSEYRADLSDPRDRFRAGYVMAIRDVLSTEVW